MKKFPKFLAGLVVLALFGSMSLQAQDKAGALAIVVNKASALDDVASPLLQKYFKAEKTKAPDGTKLVIVMMDLGRPERDAALHTIYKMSESEYNDYFVGQTFTGAVAAAPKSFASPGLIKQFVAGNVGAISYLRASDADDTVKVLKVDGKLPGDAGYPLTF